MGTLFQQKPSLKVSLCLASVHQFNRLTSPKVSHYCEVCDADARQQMGTMQMLPHATFLST